jgi:hypothetical protein
VKTPTDRPHPLLAHEAALQASTLVSCIFWDQNLSGD